MSKVDAEERYDRPGVRILEGLARPFSVWLCSVGFYISVRFFTLSVPHRPMRHPKKSLSHLLNTRETLDLDLTNTQDHFTIRKKKRRLTCWPQHMLVIIPLQSSFETIYFIQRHIGTLSEVDSHHVIVLHRLVPAVQLCQCSVVSRLFCHGPRRQHQSRNVASQPACPLGRAHRICLCLHGERPTSKRIQDAPQ